MELTNQDINRILETLGPALKAEFDRVIKERRGTYEDEIETKFRAAVKDVESESKRAAATELEQAVAEAREETRKKVTQELEFQSNQTLLEAKDQLRAQLDAERKQLDAERKQLVEQIDEWRICAEAPQQLAEAGSQPEILLRFITMVERFAPAVAVYIARPDGLNLWKTCGGGIFPQKMSQNAATSEMYFREVIVRDKLVAAVCAARPFKVDALDRLITALAGAIELFGLRMRSPAPAPARPGVAVAAAVGSNGVRPTQKDNVQ